MPTSRARRRDAGLRVAEATMHGASRRDEQARRRATALQLADLWNAAGAGAGFCAPGCACGAGMLFSLGPGEIEADVMAFLHSRFDAGQGTALREVLADRSRSVAAGNAPPFGTWLRELAEAPLESPEFDAVADSLGTILQSLVAPNGATAAANRFSCTQTQDTT
jgi:hypothetical protein